MKKLLFCFCTLCFILGANRANAQEVVLSHKIHSTEFTNDGEVYEIIGEITNNSGNNVKGVSVNVNYYDASGKKLKGSNFLTNAQQGDYSDSQSSSVDYLANGKTAPFRFIRFVNKISGKVARSEVIITAIVVKATTCAVIENLKTEKIDFGGGVFYYKVTGSFKCTAGKVFNGSALIAGYDANGKILQVSNHPIDGVDGLTNGQSVNFEAKFWENDFKFVKILAFPSYRGDWNEN